MIPMFLTGVFALMISAVYAPAAAQDQEGVAGFVFVGPALAPDYEGGDDYEVIPGFVGQVRYGGRSVTLTPADLDVDLLPSERFTLGPSLSFRFERDDVDNTQVDLLDDVDSALEVGVNGAINFSSLLKDQDGLSLGLRFTQDATDGHGGFVGRANANYTYPFSQKLSVVGGLELTAVSDDYADAYFDVSAAQSARSGLTAYDAEGGLKDVKVSLLVNYAFNERWGVGAYVSYARLVGDFADSSIVTQTGSENQFFGLLGLQYRF